jgi:hypothetical protein
MSLEQINQKSRDTDDTSIELHTKFTKIGNPQRNKKFLRKSFLDIPALREIPLVLPVETLKLCSNQ